MTRKREICRDTFCSRHNHDSFEKPTWTIQNLLIHQIFNNVCALAWTPVYLLLALIQNRQEAQSRHNVIIVPERSKSALCMRKLISVAISALLLLSVKCLPPYVAFKVGIVLKNNMATVTMLKLATITDIA